MQAFEINVLFKCSGFVHRPREGRISSSVSEPGLGTPGQAHMDKLSKAHEQRSGGDALFGESYEVEGIKTLAEADLRAFKDRADPWWRFSATACTR